MRLGWIDIVRGICIYSVVLSHTLNVPIFYRSIFEPFFLTGFFFLSGVVFKPNSIGKSLFGSTAKILWPYFINAIIIMLGSMKWIELLYIGDFTGVVEYFQYRGTKIMMGKAFWFLACLFIVQVLATFIIKALKNNKLHMLIVAVLCFASITGISGTKIAPWSANTAILALGYFLVGVICKDKLMSIDLEKIKRYWGVIAICIYIVIVVLLYILLPKPLSFDLHIHKLSPELVYLLLSFIGIISLCLFAMSLKKCKLLQMLGENSLIIYMYHGYGGLITNVLFGLLHIKLLESQPYAYTILFSFASILITLGIALLINKYCPVLIGRGACINNISKRLFSK